METKAIIGIILGGVMLIPVIVCVYAWVFIEVRAGFRRHNKIKQPRMTMDDDDVYEELRHDKRI